MEALKRLWSAFRAEWDDDITNHAEKLNGSMGILNPQFADFMDWLCKDNRGKGSSTLVGACRR